MTNQQANQMNEVLRQLRERMSLLTPQEKLEILPEILSELFQLIGDAEALMDQRQSAETKNQDQE